MRRFTLAFLFALCCSTAAAQRKCATEEAIAQQLAAHPALVQKFRSAQEQWGAARPKSPFFRVNPRISIPIVVHIVLPNPNQVTDAQVMEQIESLNLDYIARNTDVSQVPAVWQALVGNAEIQFCLAARTPSGDPTTGITRTTTTFTSFSADNAARAVKHTATGGAAGWDPDKYLNVWVCGLTNNYLGVATPPGNVFPADEDGVVVSYRAFGKSGTASAPFNLGRTLTHEVGHYFGLRHIWGDDSGACTSDDGVTDTPLQGDQNYGCPTFPRTDACTPAAPGIMFMNYMDYVNDACMYLFTSGQVDRMRNAIDLQRASLLSSDGCQPVVLRGQDASITAVQQPQGYLCDASQTPVVTLRNRGTSALTKVTIAYSVAGGAPVTYAWTGNLASQTETSVTLPGFVAGDGAFSLKAYTQQPNGTADDKPDNDTTIVSFSHYTATALPFAEGFESGIFPPAGFSITNPDRSFTWERASFGSRGSNYSAVMRNLGYASNDLVDDLISPEVNAAGADSVFLFFDLAAALATAPNTIGNPWDTLEVLVTLDCGQTFLRTGYKKWGATLMTRNTPTTTEFIPAASDWRTDSVDLTALTQGRKFRVAFRNTTNYENNIYLDNINVLKKARNATLSKQGILIWPNPVRDRFLIEFLTWPEDLRAISVFDASGKLVQRSQPVVRSGNRTTIDLVNAPNGVYFVTLFYSKEVRTYKIVKAK
ncbi:M43 family zinc metalloprotease [Chitinophaga lutea]